MSRTRSFVNIGVGQPGNATYQGPSLLENDLIVDLAKKYDVSTGQIVLSWGVLRGTSVVPKSENEDRLRRNITVSVNHAHDGRIITDHAGP